MFQKTKNIDTAFRMVRGFCVLWFLGCLSVCLYVLYNGYQLNLKGQNRLYLLAGDKVLEAYQSERKDNIGVELRDHIKVFHTYFFTLDPDEKIIEANLSHAMYLADNSAKKQYDDLKETGYYAGVMSGNISQRISVDSIQVNLGQEPYAFRCYATIRITRPTSIVTRNLITQGYLRNVSRSDHNPHGFLVEKWETLANNDIKTESR